MECIILAGGLGTRLRNTIGDQPKCIASVNGKPFLHYLFDYLEKQNCCRVILSLGYKHEIVTAWLASQKRNFETDFVIETEPLGTGGGIQLAMKKASEAHVFVLNGDTFFDVSLQEQLALHTANKAATTLALKAMKDFERYGVVNFNEANQVLSFEEKQYREEGWINGGVYVIDRNYFLQKELPAKFSFEKDYLEAFVTENNFYAYKSDNYFIDIGIPSDYEQAQEDFKELFS